MFGGESGQRFRFHWLLPLPARFPPGDAAARIFGYCTGSISRMGGGGGGSSSARGDRARQAIAAAGRGQAGAAGDLELAECGGVPNGGGGGGIGSDGYTADLGGGGGYAAPEAEPGLRHAARQSLSERLEAMPEVESGSEGEFR